MITKLNNYIQSKQPYLCDIIINKFIDNFDENLFGPFQDKIDRKTFDINISKSLCYNNEIIGGYLLDKKSMFDTLSDIIYWNENGKIKNLNFFVNQEFIDKYKYKNGILSDFIYIDKKYNGKNYGNILIEYAKSLGDYTWGLSVPNETTEYWIEKQKRIPILEYIDCFNEPIKVILTSTKI